MTHFWSHSFLQPLNSVSICLAVGKLLQQLPSSFRGVALTVTPTAVDVEPSAMMRSLQKDSEWDGGKRPNPRGPSCSLSTADLANPHTHSLLLTPAGRGK